MICSECGGAPRHTVLWLSNSSDILTLGFARFRYNKIVIWLAALGSWVLTLLSGILFSIGRLLGFFTLNDTVETVTNARSRVMWEEAKRREIPIRQIYVFGAPLEMYRIVVKGKTYIVDGLALPPWREAEALHIDDKISFKEMLRKAGLPAPKSESAFILSHAKKLLTEFSRVCVKPRSGSNGLHTYPYVSTEKELEHAFRSAKQMCYLLSVEEHLEGNLCRATCVDGKLIGFLESSYPTVTGDGISTVEELVKQMNDKRPEKVEEVVMTASHTGYIARRGYSLESVLPEGMKLQLTYRAGAVSGGRNFEHGHNIHPTFIPLIEKAAALTELPVVGFDLIIPDPLSPADSQRWGFIEANSFPWINLHHTPFSGEPVNVAKHVWDLWDK